MAKFEDLTRGAAVKGILPGGLVTVRPDVAAAQVEKDPAPPPITGTRSGIGESAEAGTSTTSFGTGGSGGETGKGTGACATKTKAPVLRLFYGSAKIDATRLSRDADLIASFGGSARRRVAGRQGDHYGGDRSRNRLWRAGQRRNGQ
jgi:hypothetical protein